MPNSSFGCQARVSDQNQVITMHRVHTADLHERLNAANTALFKSNHEVQRLREELRLQTTKLVVKSDDRNGYDIWDRKSKSMSPVSSALHDFLKLIEFLLFPFIHLSSQNWHL